jgi:tRNA G10  N-methylase Trm11
MTVMVDVPTEQNMEVLRQVAVLQDAEIRKLGERIAAIAAENEKLRQLKAGRLQQELEAVKEHLAKLQKIQFGASSEKRTRDDTKKRRRKKRQEFGARSARPRHPGRGLRARRSRQNLSRLRRCAR